jgi:RNA polymerase sigma-70 factor (ECF subfamily)
VQSDQDLLRDIAHGNAEALGALYDAHARVVFALAKRVLGTQEDAEEVVQDVFAYVWREAARYEVGRATVAGWLVMLTRTRAIDKLRSRQARPDLNQAADPTPVLDTSISRSATPEALAVTKDDARRVGAALNHLPGDQRSLIDLAYFEGLSQSEIAERTGTPLGTVKTRMRTALQTMRAAMSS